MSSFSFFLFFLRQLRLDVEKEIRSRGERERERFLNFPYGNAGDGDSATDFVVISPTPSLWPRAARIPSFDCIHRPPCLPPITSDVDLETQIWMRARAHNVAIVSRIQEFSDFSDANCNRGFWGVYRRTIQCFLQRGEVLILLKESY